jgi:hypothetical protein
MTGRQYTTAVTILRNMNRAVNGNVSGHETLKERINSSAMAKIILYENGDGPQLGSEKERLVLGC